MDVSVAAGTDGRASAPSLELMPSEGGTGAADPSPDRDRGIGTRMSEWDPDPCLPLGCLCV
jgi:hypothetical protein